MKYNIEWELQQLENLTIVGAHFLTKQEIPDYPEYEGEELIPKNVTIIMEELRDVLNKMFESDRKKTLQGSPQGKKRLMKV